MPSGLLVSGVEKSLQAKVRLEEMVQTCYASAILWVICNEAVLVKALWFQIFSDYSKEITLDTQI